MEFGATHLLRWLWENSLGATLLCVGAVMLTFLAGRILPAKIRYALWLLVMLRLVWPFTPSAGFSVLNLISRPAAQAAVATKVAVLESPASPSSSQPVQAQRAVRKRTGVPVLFVIWFVGAAASLVLVGLKHRRLSRWLARQPSSCQPRLATLLDRAAVACGTRTRFDRVVVSSEIAVPAVFRFRKPILLLPASLVSNATDDELLLVLMHEVVHVKRRDVLINWLCIIIRSVHWFNPAAWFAWKRLCAEREHVCDAVVLSQLNPSQRAMYGGLLLKLASEAFRPVAGSILVPILQRKPEIHRRIVMISRFKPASIALSVLSAIVVLVLACLTFTRAAEKSKPTQAGEAPPSVRPATKQPSAEEILQQRIDQQRARVEERQERVNQLRTHLGITSRDEESGGAAEKMRKLETMRLEAQSEYKKVEILYKLLRGMSADELRGALPTALPDAQLATLLEQRNSADQKLADLVESHAPDHPDVKRITRVLAQIEKQIADRTAGILSGMQVKMSAEQAHLEDLSKELVMLKDHTVERAVRIQPYDEAVRALQLEERMLERLRLRAAQAQLDTALPGSKQ